MQHIFKAFVKTFLLFALATPNGVPFTPPPPLIKRIRQVLVVRNRKKEDDEDDGLVLIFYQGITYVLIPSPSLHSQLMEPFENPIVNQ